MKHNKATLFNVFLQGAVLLVTGITIGFAQEQPKLSIAPVNPELLQYIENAKAGKVQTFTTPEGYTLGLMPGPIDMSYMNGMKVYPIDKSLALPSFYDLRSLGKVTGVRD